MKDSEYHAMHDHVSATMLKQFIEDRSKYRDYYVEHTHSPPGATSAMDLGSVLHYLILEGKSLRSIVGAYPDYDPILQEFHNLTGKKRDELTDEEIRDMAKHVGVEFKALKTAKGGKELKALQSTVGKNVMSATGRLNSEAAKEWRDKRPQYQFFMKRHGGTQQSPSLDLVREAYRAFRSSEYGPIVEMDHIIKEKPIFWQQGDIKCRCKPDFLYVNEAEEKAIVYDLKISQDAVDFEAKANKMGYWVQQQHYSRGVMAEYDVNTVVYNFLVQQPEYPFHTVVHRFNDDDLPSMERAYDRWFGQLIEAHLTNNFSLPQTKHVQVMQFWDRHERNLDALEAQLS